MGVFEYKAEVPVGDGTVEDVTLTFKDIALLPLGIERKHRGNDTERMWAMFEWGLGEDQWEVFDRIPRPQLPKMITAWQESEGVELGESVASSASSTSTVRRSKRTSSATDSD